MTGADFWLLAAGLVLASALSVFAYQQIDAGRAFPCNFDLLSSGFGYCPSGGDAGGKTDLELVP